MNREEELEQLLKDIRGLLREMHQHAIEAEQRAEEFRAVALRQQQSGRRLYIRVVSVAVLALAGIFYYLFTLIK